MVSCVVASSRLCRWTGRAGSILKTYSPLCPYFEYQVVNKLAEFCKDCFYKLGATLMEHEKLIVSDDLDLCEGCGQWKHVVEYIRPKTTGERWREIRTRKPKPERKPKGKPK